jgi:hypothetical protein
LGQGVNHDAQNCDVELRLEIVERQLYAWAQSGRFR